MDKIEKIRQEIERRRLHFNKEAEKYQALNNGYSQNCYGARDALRDLENFLDTLSEEPDKSLEEAARRYQEGVIVDTTIYYCGACEDVYFANRIADAFIAGAEWQAEQDDRDVVFWKGMQYAIAEMKKEAVEGVIIDSGFDDGTAFVTMNIPDRRYDRGDKVRIIILPKED